MPKRSQDRSDSQAPPPKRSRCATEPDRLSALSDELVLLILGYLPIESLITCQTLSHRFNVLAGDSQLWKRQYYHRWIFPRSRRVRGTTNGAEPRENPTYSSNMVKWLDHVRTLYQGRDINWMKEYRLQHNWSIGSCRVRELELAQPPLPLLVSLHDGAIYTADIMNGLRVWSMKNADTMLANSPFSGVAESATPTAITVSAEGHSNEITTVIGFDNGAIGIYSLDTKTKQITCRLSQILQADGKITSLASCAGYLLVLFKDKTLSLFRLASDFSLRRIDSLQASNVRAPLSLSVRTVGANVLASIAYSFPRIGCDWSLGLQEIRWDEQGNNIGSHLATPLDSPLAGSFKGVFQKIGNTYSPNQLPFPYPSHKQPPTSISYTHPYLLAAHADNTLTLYLAMSTAERLTISPPLRLWGHTSSISGVQVGGRGKAVSVSSRGDDIRVWELEDLMSPSLLAKRPPRVRGRSVQLNPEKTKKQQNLGPRNLVFNLGTGFWLANRDDDKTESAKIRGLVGFDEEQVVVLREQDLETQLLDCYDFT